MIESSDEIYIYRKGRRITAPQGVTVE